MISKDLFLDQKKWHDKESLFQVKTQEKKTFISFHVGQSLFIVPITQVVEVTNRLSLRKFPVEVPHFLGVVGLRGKTIPVLDMRVHGEENNEMNDMNERMIFIFHEQDEENIVGIYANQVKKISIPWENSSVQTDQEVVTIQNVPVRLFSMKSIFQQG